MSVAGVYRREHGGTLTLVHEYQDEDYELADVATLLGIGRLAGDGAELVLERRELRALKVTADAQSFDHGADFIRMCMDIAAHEPDAERDVLRLVSVG